MQTFKMKIPFQGFYESIHSENMQAIIEDEFEEGHINEGQAIEFNYRACWIDYAKLYTEKLSEALEIDFTFVELWSPREYNFQSDEITVEMTLQSFCDLCEICDMRNLRLLVKEECTSRSGFISHYSNSLTEWLRTRFDQWEMPQLSLIMQSVVDLHLDDGFEHSLIDNCNGELSEIIHNQIN